ncbi:cysteine-rich with EGF-like domain protein 2 [Paramormyrops kingsleyae]|uniref:cysteine-rich with EGF-like domain protein 2 n=1 Tax=Paramormyrops kingsleyae TaxID=1676925 RepID=UPI000CD6111C|nr:cysteine-rich with EGF-like domain protein 2 [Paramormyrops kingsleyae]
MQSLPSAVALLTAVMFALHIGCTEAAKLKDSCSTCRQITDNFSKEFDRTAKKNFGGGNTAWEERKLSKYETSEIRLVEILENVCDSSSFECNQMVEEHEEQFETWWFKRKTKHPDLFKWFCVDSIKVCCPKGTFGPDCNACLGGSERPCHGNGACDGDGTRDGHGQCSCNHGYEGEFCLDCIAGFYNEERNDTHSVCTECHDSCKTCTGSTNRECSDCKPGWEKDQEGACNDVDECSGESPPCKEDQYCLNTEGSYSCKACDKPCLGCRGAGPDHCLACADGYRDEEGVCADMNECELAEPACPGEHRECVNMTGSFRCICASGFQDQGGVCVEAAALAEESQDESDSGPSDSSETTEPPRKSKLPEEREDL